MGEFGSLFGDLDWGPGIVSHIQLNFPRQPLHAQDKEVRGEGIPLSYASRGFEEVSFLSIHQDRYGRGTDIGHDKLSKARGEIEE